MAKRKFYRGTLPTVVWDPSAGAPLAEFIKGQFITVDEDIADALVRLGYKEVSLVARKPPETLHQPVKDVGDVRIMPGGMSEKVELDNLEVQADAIEREARAEAKAEAKAKAKAKGKGTVKKSGGKTIKRRAK